MEASTPQSLTAFPMGQAGVHKASFTNEILNPSLFINLLAIQAVLRPSRAGTGFTITINNSTSVTYPPPGAVTARSLSQLPWMGWMTLDAWLTRVGEGAWSAVGVSTTTCILSRGAMQRDWRQARSSGDSWKRRPQQRRYRPASFISTTRNNS